jgi:hypothetical protein
MVFVANGVQVSVLVLAKSVVYLRMYIAVQMFAPGFICAICAICGWIPIRVEPSGAHVHTDGTRPEELRCRISFVQNARVAEA